MLPNKTRVKEKNLKGNLKEYVELNGNKTYQNMWAIAKAVLSRKG